MRCPLNEKKKHILSDYIQTTQTDGVSGFLKEGNWNSKGELFFLKKIYLFYAYECSLFYLHVQLYVRKGRQMAVNHHAVAGNRSLNLWKSSQFSWTAEPSLQTQENYF